MCPKPWSHIHITTTSPPIACCWSMLLSSFQWIKPIFFFLKKSNYIKFNQTFRIYQYHVHYKIYIMRYGMKYIFVWYLHNIVFGNIFKKSFIKIYCAWPLKKAIFIGTKLRISSRIWSKILDLHYFLIDGQQRRRAASSSFSIFLRNTQTWGYKTS
jgi:hypothetical protein